MKNASHLLVLLLASTSLTACAVDADDASPDGTSDGTSSSPNNGTWVGDLNGTHKCLGDIPAMAALNGVEYYVYPWGKNDTCWEVRGTSHQLYWHSCDATGACTAPQALPNQLSMDKVNMAAFNGRIYMVHDGDSDGSAVWISSLNPATGVWTSNVHTSYTTFNGAPALAAFGNHLFLVGVQHTGSTHPMWWATMDTSENFSPAQALGSETVTEPSLAVFNSQLVVAHRLGSNQQIVTQTLSSGGTIWSAPTAIPSGSLGGFLEGDDPQIAVAGGDLHLVHHQASGGEELWWTYQHCGAWTAEQMVPNYKHSFAASMATGNGGFVLNGVSNLETGLYTDLTWYKERYLPATQLRDCGITTKPGN